MRIYARNCIFGLMFSTIINNYIRANGLISGDDRVIVGLSGGADSVALLSVLRDLNIPICAAHCNFHLRGEESDRDESFCRELCHILDIPLYVKHFDVSQRLADTNESVEMACRNLRYDWWNDLINEGVGTILAVGHHREDNIETFFINLFRGCGLAGLKAMLPKNGYIIRPLLDVSRHDIEAYLGEKGLSFVTDSTNLHDEYRRNKIRLNILPVIEKNFPGATDSIANTIDNLRGNYALYMEYIEQLRTKHISNDGNINVADIVRNSSDPVTAIHEIASPLGLNSSQAEEIVKCVSEPCRGGGRWFNGLLLDRGILHTSPSTPRQNISLKSATISPEEFYKLLQEKRLNSDALYLDTDKIEGKALVLRPWSDGDRIRPFGMNGSRLVSDILSDAKIPLNQKRNVRIVECDGKILWVVGFRTSRHYAVTSDTRNVTVVTIVSD